MRSNYKKIGNFIQLVDERNKDLEVKTLLGLSISKKFIPSVANTVGTDMANYKIIRKNQFACSIMQVRRDKKMPVALLQKFDEAIISQAYPVFEVIDKKSLLPEYLMMWMTRSEFDRHACFLAVGGVRGSLEWEDFCNMELPIPSIEKQREIVKEYNVIVDRIKLNEDLNAKLEETAQAVYREWFVAFEFPVEEPPSSLKEHNQLQPPNPLKGELNQSSCSMKVGYEGEEVPKVLNSANPKLYRELYEKAVEMRKNPTRAEAIIWEELKGKKLGYKFRQQHIIDQFIVDFYCVKKGLVIEIDGEIHDRQKERDFEREKVLKSLGCEILRFTNEEVFDDLGGILNRIKKVLEAPQPPEGGVLEQPPPPKGGVLEQPPAPKGEQVVKSPLGDLGAVAKGDSGSKKGYKSTGGEMVFCEELGKEVPRGWEVIPISEIISVKDGTHDSPSPSNEGYPLVTSKNLDLYNVNFDGTYLISENDYNQINKRSEVEQFDILFSMIGTVGLISYIDESEIKFAIKNVGLFKTSENNFLTKYILFYLKSVFAKEYIKSCLSGSTQSYVTLTVLRQIPLLIPENNSIKLFNKRINPILKNIIEYSKETQLLFNMKNLLLSKLATAN